MNSIQIALLGVVGTLLALQFKSGKSEYGIYVSLAVSLFLFLCMLSRLEIFVQTVKKIADYIKLDAGQMSILLKMAGVTYVAEFASGICKDAGYQNIAVQIEIFTKLTILAIGMPVLLALLDEFDFRQIDQLSGETELGEKVRFRDLTEMLISGNTKELGERFLEFFSGQVFSVFQKGRKNLARLLLITVAAAFFSNFTSIFQNRQTAEAGFYILYLVVIAICLEAYQSMNLYAEEKTGELVQLMQVFCPSFFLAVAFTGKSSSALMFYNTILFLIYLVELLVLHFLLPAVKIYGMVRVLSCLTGEDLFSEFAELLEKCIQWSLKSMIAAVSGISLIRGFLNPAIDSLKMTAAGRTLEAVPWIGDVAGGTMDVALGVAVLLKNGIGVAGMIFIAVLALIPLVEFLILAFLYQLVAALVQPVSDRRITTCISGVSSGYQLMVKVIASTTLLFVLSIALVVAVTS